LFIAFFFIEFYSYLERKNSFLGSKRAREVKQAFDIMLVVKSTNGVSFCIITKEGITCVFWQIIYRNKWCIWCIFLRNV